MYEHGLSSLQENTSSSSSKANTIKLLKVLSYDCLFIYLFLQTKLQLLYKLLSLHFFVHLVRLNSTHCSLDSYRIGDR